MAKKPLIVESDIPRRTAVMVVTETDLGFDCELFGDEDDDAFMLVEYLWDTGREGFTPDPEDLN